jgi:hypothetical protein
VKAKAPAVARSGRIRLALLPLFAAAFLFLPSSAFAEIVVNLNGSGAGTVTSKPAGIECSNVGGGAAGPDCSQSFPIETSPGSGQLLEVKLAAKPDKGFYLAGWSGDDPDFFGVATCNTGSANPCTTTDLEEFGITPITITATFEPLPELPLASTGNSGPGANERLIELQGTVNPSEFKVSDCRFEYGLSDKYGASTPCVPDAAGLGEGATDVPVSAELESEQLLPGATYHYRLLASNVAGTSEGEDRTFATAPVADGCANAAIRATQALAAVLLPDCMALEMVSPPRKGGQAAFRPAVSAAGERVIFTSSAALGGTPGNVGVEGDPYVATRGPSGWTTSYTSPPTEIIGGWNSYVPALSFSPDFSRWYQVGSTLSQIQVGIARAFEGGLGGHFSPLSPLFGPLNGGIRTDVIFSQFQGASADRSHLFFVTGNLDVAYLPGDPEPSGTGAANNTYLAKLDSNGNPSLELLARDGAGKAWGGACGSRVGGSGLEAGDRNQGAISGDGSRVYFTSRPDQPQTGSCSSTNKLRILQRLESKQGTWIDELFSSECNRATPACSSADGDDHYQGASTDGTRVYLMSTRQLADSDLDEGSDCSVNIGTSEGCDLYLYDSTLPIGQRLIQVSAGEPGAPTPGEGANVLNGTTAISGDGSHVYFVAQGVLSTDPSPKGASPIAGQPNLYVWDRSSEDTSFIGTLVPGTLAFADRLWGIDGHFAVPELGTDSEGNEVGGDGHILSFVSRAPLTADDSDGTRRDVFRYDADTGELLRVSKAGPGGIDNGSFDVGAQSGANYVGANPLGTDFAEQRRRVSEDANTIVFSSEEGLLPGDVNERSDHYLWRAGQLFRLPGQVGASNGETALSHDGSTVAFITPSALLPQDGDQATDVYALRVGGGYPNAIAAVPCQGEACQGSASAPPAAPDTASAAFTGPGNVVKGPPKCRKGFVRRRGSCVKKKSARRRKAAQRRTGKRDANTDRRAAK